MLPGQVEVSRLVQTQSGRWLNQGGEFEGPNGGQASTCSGPIVAQPSRNRPFAITVQNRLDP